MSIIFLTRSILTTVQDLGRNNFRRFGINPNGAMDKTAVRLINILLGNEETEGVLEMHFPAPKILFEADGIIALGGANFSARIDDLEIENWRPVPVRKGSTLSFPAKISGNRIYLAVRGGFMLEKWLGSFSTNSRAKIGGFRGGTIQKNDRLFFRKIFNNKETEKPFSYKISESLIPLYSYCPTVRIIAGAEFENLIEESRACLQSESFMIRNESDRMGFRLQGIDLYISKKSEFLSSAVNFGTIQLLPDKQLIALMADHQTSGGYPRLAHVISRDLPLVAQLGAHDQLCFQIVSLGEAENLILENEVELNYLKTAVTAKLKRNTLNDT